MEALARRLWPLGIVSAVFLILNYLESQLQFRTFGMNDLTPGAVIANTILGRMLHHSTTINIEGNSYRLKEKVKAGFIRAPAQ